MCKGAFQVSTTLLPSKVTKTKKRPLSASKLRTELYTLDDRYQASGLSQALQCQKYESMFKKEMGLPKLAKNQLLRCTN